MNLNAFSVSLAVRDIDTSRFFYEKLGFKVFHGEQEHGWLIMKSGTTVIGLFQNMIDQNTLTFNPGWDQAGKNIDPFTDIREIQTALEQAGIKIEQGTSTPQGPDRLLIKDPDGNPILIDQHR